MAYSCSFDDEDWRDTRIKAVTQTRCAIEPRLILYEDPKKIYRLHGVQFVKFENEELYRDTRNTAVNHLHEKLIQENSTKKIQICEVPRSGNPPALKVRIVDQNEKTDVSEYMISTKGYLEKDDGTTHSKSGGTQTAGGLRYPRLWCMWMLLKLKEHGTEFSLTTEYEKAGKFDDIFLQFKDKLTNQKNELFIQIKHKEKESIEFQNLEELNRSKIFVFEEIANSLRHLDISNDEIKHYFMLLTNANISFNQDAVKYKIINEPCLHNIFVPGCLLQIHNLPSNLEKFENQIIFAVNQYSIDTLESMIEDMLLAISNGNKILTRIKFSYLQILVQDSIETMRVFHIGNELLDERLAECDAIGQIHHNLQEPTSDAIERLEEQSDASKVLSEEKEVSELIDVQITGEEEFNRTELARKIVYNCKEDFDHIIWIDGSIPEFDFLELGRKLNLIFSEENKEAKIEKIFSELNNFRTLLIFENATKNTPMPAPGKYKNIYIVVTSEFMDRKSNLNILLSEATFDQCADFLGEKVFDLTENHCNRTADFIAKTPIAIKTILEAIPIDRENVETIGGFTQVVADSVEYLSSSPGRELLHDTALNLFEDLVSAAGCGAENTKTLYDVVTGKLIESFEQFTTSETAENALKIASNEFQDLFDFDN